MELEKFKQKLKASYERINQMQHFISKVDVCKATLKMKKDEINDHIASMTMEIWQQLQNFQQEIELALTKTVEDRLSKLETLKNRIHSANAHLMQVCMDAEGLLKGRSEDLLGKAVQNVYSKFEETWQQLDYEEEKGFGNMTGIVFYSNAHEFLTKTYLATLSEVDKCGMVLSKQVFWVKSMQSDAPSQKAPAYDSLEKAVNSATSVKFGEADDVSKVLKKIPNISKNTGPRKHQHVGATKNLPSCVRICAVDLCPEEVDTTHGNSEQIKKVVTIDSRFSPNIPENKCGECMVGEVYKKLQKSSSSEGSHASSDDSSINSFKCFLEQSETDFTVDMSNVSSTKSNTAVHSFAIPSPESTLNVSSNANPTEIYHTETDLQICDSSELEEDFVWVSDEDEFSDKRLMGLENSSFSNDSNSQSKLAEENRKKLPAPAPDTNIFVGCPATSSKELKESQEQEHDSVSKGRLASKVVVFSRLQSDALSSSFPRSINVSYERLDIRSHMVHVGKGYFEVYAKCVQKICGSFYFPIGVCTNSTGAVIVADTGNNKMKIYQNGHITNSFGQRLSRPSAVVVNKKDEIFVKDFCCIHHFDPQGSFIKTIGNKKMHIPYGLGMTHDEQLVVLDTLWQNPRILIFTEDGQMSSHSYQPLLNPPPSSKCRFLAVHQGEVLTSDLGSSCLYMTSLKGELHRILGLKGSGPGELFEPSGIACDDAGNWIVADSKNDRIQVFAPNGYYLCKIQLSEPIRRPSGIHLTAEGHLYVINYLDGIIKVFKLG